MARAARRTCRYPAIAERAKAEGGEIHWGDETALTNTHGGGRSYAPKGETPVALAPGTRQKLSMISTVTNQGKARWMIIDGNFNADQLIEFLEALIKDATKKVFLILDNLRAHHSKLGLPSEPIASRSSTCQATHPTSIRTSV